MSACTLHLHLHSHGLTSHTTQACHALQSANPVECLLTPATFTAGTAGRHLTPCWCMLLQMEVEQEFEELNEQLFNAQQRVHEQQQSLNESEAKR